MQNATASLVFCLEELKKNFTSLARLAQQHDAKLLFPCKSFPALPVIALARNYFAGFDISNYEEYVLTRKSKKVLWLNSPQLFNPARFPIHTIFNCQSVKQLQAIQDKSRWWSIRVNAEALALTKTNSGSRFGLHLDEAVALLTQAKQNQEGLRFFKGLHFHLGTQHNRSLDYLRIAAKIVDRMKREQIFLPAINIGGGYASMSWTDIHFTIKKIRSLLLPTQELYLEPGQILTRNAGYAIANAQDITRDGTCLYIHTDLSAIAHLRWSSPQLLFPKVPLGKYRVVFCGPTCAETDRISEIRSAWSQKKWIDFLAQNKLKFGGINGYSFAWNRDFNGVPNVRIIFAKTKL